MSGTLDYYTDWFGNKFKTSEYQNEIASKEAAAKLAKQASVLSTAKGATSIGSGALDFVAGLTGLNKAETMGGTENAVMQGMDVASNALIKYGGIPGVIAGGAMKVLKFANEYGGKSSEQQATLGADVGSYNFQTSTNAGKKFSLIQTLSGKHKKTNNITNLADIANIKAMVATNQNKSNLLESQGNMENIISRNQTDLLGGVSTRALVAKKGAVLTRSELSKIVKKAKNSKKSTVPNVIPEGALHARLNKIDGELKDQVTPKGIPVISYESGDKIVQHAEIENSEIIFNKQVSVKLEEMFEKYKKANDDEKITLEIECGKLLVDEILDNTVDNVGLLND